MTQKLSAAACEVIERCQARLRLLEPGSQAAQITEHAITLALSPNRPSKEIDLMFGDVLRDARRTVTRSKSRHLRLVSEVGRFAEQEVATGAISGYADHDSPEHQALACELLGIVRRRAVELGDRTPRVLAGLLVGETESQTAHAAGVSRSTVTRAVRELRTSAVAAGYYPKAA